MRRLPPILLVLVLLGFARLFPGEGFGLWLRLGAALLCLLLPGALLARALRQPGASAALVWSLGLLFAASAVMFAVGGSLRLALILYALAGIGALVAAVWRSVPAAGRGGLVLLLGVGFGIALWQMAPVLDGDALFHLARVRKLDAFPSLHLRTVDEFRDGGLHPGYAFPLWHVLLALMAKLGGVDPSLVLRHAASLLVPLAFLIAYEAGVAVFRTASAGFAALAAQVAIIGFAPGHGGAYTALALPATASRQLLVPAVIALFFVHVRAPSRTTAASLAAAGLTLALVHPTYALFVAIPLVGYVVARWLLARAELRRGLAGLAALLVPVVGVFLWLLPIVRESASHDPSPAERLRGLRHYADQLNVGGPHHFRLAPEVFGRTGAVAIAALVLVPFAVAASRRRWAAFVLGGSLIVLALTLIPEFFVRFSDAVSLSQSRRLAGFLPFAFAFAGGAAVLARSLRLWVVPLAALAGALLEDNFPGNFLYGKAGGPALPAWIALYGGLAALVAGAVFLRRRDADRRGPLCALAALAFVLPVAADANWTTPARETSPLTSGVIAAVRAHVPRGAVLFSDDATSYRIAATAPIYVASASPSHVADTKANRPYARSKDVKRFFRTGDLAIPRRYGAQWLLVDRARSSLRPALPLVYRDRRFALYRL